MKLKSMLVTGAIAVAAGGFAPAVHAVPVGTELLLLADVSGSLNSTDFALQRDGYANAFRDDAVISAIEAAGGIAVALVYWSDSSSIAVNWTHVFDAATSFAFASAVESAPRTSSGGTAMTSALNFGAGLFATNGYDGRLQIIDISGDGSEGNACSFNAAVCAPLQGARDAALAGGVDRINAIWIEDEAQPSSRNFFCLDPACIINPLAYGETNVIGGTDSFQMVVSNFDDFSEAIKLKLVRELTPPPPNGVPEPGMLALLGLGFFGLGALRRRMR